MNRSTEQKEIHKLFRQICITRDNQHVTHDNYYELFDKIYNEFYPKLQKLIQGGTHKELERLGIEAALAGNKFSVSKYIAIRKAELSTTKHNTSKE